MSFTYVDSKTAIKLLKEGNRRFISGETLRPPDMSETRRLLFENGQSPFAVVLGCADSRVPPEIIFDQGLGQIFAVRTAGNVTDAVATGSVEYAVEHLHAPLVVVLGHNKCGAVAAASSSDADFGENIGAILAVIKPNEDENIINTVSILKNSEILRKHMENGRLQIIGAKYDLKSGIVTFFDEI